MDHPPLGRSYLVVVPSYVMCIDSVNWAPWVIFHGWCWYQSLIDGSNIWGVDMTDHWGRIGGPMRWGTNPMRWGTNEKGDQWADPDSPSKGPVMWSLVSSLLVWRTNNEVAGDLLRKPVLHFVVRTSDWRWHKGSYPESWTQLFDHETVRSACLCLRACVWDRQPK